MNIATFRFDFFGHGESGGKFEDVTVSEGFDDILCAIKFVKSLGFTKIGLVGQSYGGQTALLAAAKSKDLLALAVVAPVSDYMSKKVLDMTEEGIKKWRKDGYIYHISGRGEKFRLNSTFLQDIEKLGPSYEVAKNIKVPTLILHGDADQSVPVEQSIELAKHIPNNKLVIESGADHKFSEPEYFMKKIKLISEFVSSKI